MWVSTADIMSHPASSSLFLLYRFKKTSFVIILVLQAPKGQKKCKQNFKTSATVSASLHSHHKCHSSCRKASLEAERFNHGMLFQTIWINHFQLHQQPNYLHCFCHKNPHYNNYTRKLHGFTSELHQIKLNYKAKEGKANVPVWFITESADEEQGHYREHASENRSRKI